MENVRIKVLKRLALVLISIVCLILVFSVKSNAFSLNLSANSTSVNKGDTISVTLSADEKVVTGDFELKYDKSVVEYIDDNYTNLSVKNHADEGYLKAVYVDLSGKGANSITIKFKAKATSTSTKFSMQNQNFTSSSGTSYDSATVSSPSMNLTIKDSNGGTSDGQTPSNSSNNSTNGGNTQTSDTGSTQNVTTSTQNVTSNKQVTSNQKNSTLPKAGIGFNILGVAIILMIILAIVFKKKSKYWRGVGMLILAFSITIALSGNSIYAYNKTPQYGKYDRLMNLEEKVLVFCFDKEETDSSLTDLEISKLFDDVTSFGKKQNATNIGTGDTVSFQSDGEYTILLYGDVNGDGKVNSSDIYPIIQHILGNSELDGVYAKAANLTCKNDSNSMVINSNDIYPIVKFILGDLTTNLVESFPDSTNPTNPADPTDPTDPEVEPLELQVSYSTTDKTASPVTVTISANKQIAGTYDGWKKSSDGKSIIKEYQSNGNENITIKDEDGLEKVINVSVSNIVEDFLVEKIYYNPESWTKNSVTVFITMNKQIAGTYEGWIKSSDEKTIRKTYGTNKTEDITITDVDGLKNIVHVSITNIDKEVPTISDNWYSMQSVVKKGSTLDVTFNKSQFSDSESGLKNTEIKVEREVLISGIGDSIPQNIVTVEDNIFDNDEEYNYKDNWIFEEGKLSYITVTTYDNAGNLSTKKIKITPKAYLWTEEGNKKLSELVAQYGAPDENIQEGLDVEKQINAAISLFESISGMDYVLNGDNLANIASWYARRVDEIYIEYDKKMYSAQGDSNLIASLEIQREEELNEVLTQKEELEGLENSIHQLCQYSDEIANRISEYNSKYDELNNLLYLKVEEENEGTES